jgi:flagellar basal body-associated protein FliL
MNNIHLQDDRRNNNKFSIIIPLGLIITFCCAIFYIFFCIGSCIAKENENKIIESANIYYEIEEENSGRKWKSEENPFQYITKGCEFRNLEDGQLVKLNVEVNIFQKDRRLEK